LRLLSYSNILHLTVGARRRLTLLKPRINSIHEKLMKKLATAAAVAALLGVSASASAWWGGPGWGGPGYGSGMNDWWSDMFGDGYGDFNMNMSGGGRGWGRGYNRWRDYYGYGPYGWGGGPYGYGGYPGYGYGAPYAAPMAVPAAPAAPAGEAK
jgi:hypothetical protein